MEIFRALSAENGVWYSDSLEFWMDSVCGVCVCAYRMRKKIKEISCRINWIKCVWMSAIENNGNYSQLRPTVKYPIHFGERKTIIMNGDLTTQFSCSRSVCSWTFLIQLLELKSSLKSTMNTNCASSMRSVWAPKSQPKSWEMNGKVISCALPAVTTNKVSQWNKVSSHTVSVFFGHLKFGHIHFFSKHLIGISIR